MLLLDENLSAKLVSQLAEMFSGVTHVKRHGLERSSDEAIWEFASAQRLAVVSKDTDYLRLSFLKGAPPKVIWLRVGNCSTEEIAKVLQEAQSHIHKFVASDADFLILP